MRNKNQLTKEIIYNFMLFDDFALQPAYEYLLEGKIGAVLRILYCEDIEKREIRENGRNNSLLRVQHCCAYIICLDCI